MPASLRAISERLLLIAAASILISCGGGGGGSQNNGSVTYNLSGSISEGGYLKIQVTGPVNATIDVSPDGTFTIPSLLAGAYTVTPIGQIEIFDPPSRSVVITDQDVSIATFAMTLPPDSLSLQILNEIFAQPPEAVDFSALTFPDGTLIFQDRSKPASRGRGQALTPLDVKRTAIRAMIAEGGRLACGRNGIACPDGTIWEFPEDKSLLPLIAPKQSWIAYVHSAKSITQRQTSDSPACSNYRVYGLDCSGFTTMMANAAKFAVVPAGSQSQSDETLWDASNVGLKLESVPLGSYEAGDLLFWNDHVGIALDNSLNPRVLSSMGYPSQCVPNYTDPKRGPVTYTLIGSKKGVPKKVLRLKELDDCSIPLDSAGIRLPSLCFKKSAKLTPGIERPITDFVVIDKGNDPYVTSMYVAMAAFRDSPSDLIISGAASGPPAMTYYYGRELYPIYTFNTGQDTFYSCQGLPNPHPDGFNSVKIRVPEGFTSTSVNVPVFVVQYQRKSQPESCLNGGYLPFMRVNIEDCPSGNTGPCSAFTIPVDQSAK